MSPVAVVRREENQHARVVDARRAPRADGAPGGADHVKPHHGGEEADSEVQGRHGHHAGNQARAGGPGCVEAQHAADFTTEGREQNAADSAPAPSARGKMRVNERTRDHDGAGMTSNIPARTFETQNEDRGDGRARHERVGEPRGNHRGRRQRAPASTSPTPRTTRPASPSNGGRKIARRRGCPLAILQDLQGPRLRIGELAEGEVTLVAGRTLTLTTTPTPGDAERIGVSYERLPSEVGPGDVLLLNDGLLRLRVTATTATDVRTVVEVGGVLPQRKGINAPGANLSPPSLSEKDVSDLEFGLRAGVDYVALRLRALRRRRGPCP